MDGKDCFLKNERSETHTRDEKAATAFAVVKSIPKFSARNISVLPNVGRSIESIASTMRRRNGNCFSCSPFHTVISRL